MKYYYHTDTFTNFKNKFYSRISDFSIFDCEEINLLKVVLDGLKVNYSERSGFFASKELDSGFFHLKNHLRRVKLKAEFMQFSEKISSISNKEVLLGFDRRSFVVDERRYSVYFDELLKNFEKNKLVFVSNWKNDGKNLDCDLFAEEIEKYFPFQVSNSVARRLRKSLIETYKKIQKAEIFDSIELKNIYAAIQKFFYEYISWNYFFSKVKINGVIIIAHYHREGFILACRRNGIKILELQHGLIAKEDIFYVFPEQVRAVVDRSLFPDKIFVFGKYWADVLKDGYEFHSNNVKILGYYPSVGKIISHSDKEKIEKLVKGKISVLLTTQKFLHDFFIDYVKKHFSQLTDDRVVVVKPHPGENIAIYNELNLLKNIHVLEFDLGLLLSNTNYHLTIFSTTVFDALRYNKVSACIGLDQFEDYISSITKLGIAKRIEINQNPFDFFHAQQFQLSVNESEIFFAPPDYNALLTELNLN